MSSLKWNTSGYPPANVPIPANMGTFYRPTRDGGSEAQVILRMTMEAPQDFVSTRPVRWPGPSGRLPYFFRPNMGADAGLRQRGSSQSYNNMREGSLVLSPLFIPKQALMSRYNNAVSSKFNTATGNVAIPSVFVPTATLNNYQGPATG